MRKARNYWQETCAVLAILVGFGMAGVSWADELQWPANAGPTPQTAKCYQQPGLCCDWSNQCIERGTPSYGNSLFDCGGNTVWLYIQVDANKLWGYCQGASGDCTSYSTYYCIHYNVLDGCPPGGNIKCSYFWACEAGNICVP